VEGSGRGIILMHCPGICLELLGKTTINLSQDSRSPGRYFNPGPPEYEAGLLTTRPLCSVTLQLKFGINVVIVITYYYYCTVYITHNKCSNFDLMMTRFLSKHVTGRKTRQTSYSCGKYSEGVISDGIQKHCEVEKTHHVSKLQK
jgi:hypothetical protein